MTDRVESPDAGDSWTARPVALLKSLDYRIDRHVGLVILAIHAWAIFAFGSVLFIDASSYLRLSAMWDSVENFRRLNGNHGLLWYYNYVPPGIPLLWTFLSLLPSWLIWPALAVLQHGIAAICLTGATKQLRRAFDSRAFNYAAILLCFLPFYQALHNTLTTESLTSSVVIAGLGIALSQTVSSNFDQKKFFWLLALILLSSLVRPTAGLLLFGFGGVWLLQIGKLLNWRTLALFAALVGAMTWYPMVRGAISGVYILPNTGLSSLRFSLQLNIDVSDEAREEFLALDWPSGFDPKPLLDRDNKISFGEVSQIAKSLQADGKSAEEIMHFFDEAVPIIKYDGMEAQYRALMISSGSIGLKPQCHISEGRLVERGLSAQGACGLHRRGYKDFSWMDVSQEEIDTYLNIHFKSNQKDFAKFKAAWTPYLKPGSNALKDPLHLSDVTTEAFTFYYFVAALIVLLRFPWLGLGMIGAPLGWWLTHYLVPFGNLRYSHALLPLYAFAAAMAFAIILSREWRMKAAGFTDAAALRLRRVLPEKAILAVWKSWAGAPMRAMDRMLSLSVKTSQGLSEKARASRALVGMVFAGLVLVTMITVSIGFIRNSQSTLEAGGSGWAGRLAEIRRGECLIPQTGDPADYDVEQCATVTSDQPTFMIIGDSYAADAFMVFSRVYPDYRFLQLSAPGAKFRYPENIDEDNLRVGGPLYKTALDGLLTQKGLDGVIIASTISEDSQPEVADIVSKLLAEGLEVVVLGPRLELNDSQAMLSRRVVRAQPDGSFATKPNRDYVEWTEELSTQFGDGIEFVDMISAQCDGDACMLIDPDGNLVLLDRKHLSAEGADWVASRLAATHPDLLAEPSLR